MHFTENIELGNRQTLVISRSLGHKEDMPGSGQFHVYTSKVSNNNNCWVCDKKVYSMIFWNQLVGAVELRKFTVADSDWFVAKIQKLNPDLKDIEREMKGGPHCPMIYGSFTNWKPKRMQDIREYCNNVNSDRPDIFARCKQSEKIHAKYEDVESLKGIALKMYEAEVRSYYDSYKLIWKDIVQKYMKYERPNLINANNKDFLDRRDQPLFVHPCFMDYGR